MPTRTFTLADWATPIDLGANVIPGSVGFTLQGQAVTDWDLHGHVWDPGAVASVPWLDHATGVLDARNHNIDHLYDAVTAGARDVEISWDNSRAAYSKEQHYRKALSKLHDDADVQNAICWLWNLFPTRPIVIQGTKGYSGTVEIPDGAMLQGEGNARLQVLPGHALRHIEAPDSRRVKEQLGCAITSFMPLSGACEHCTFRDIELDGNFQNNDSWVGGETEAAIQHELQNTPSWSGLARHPQNGRVISATQSCSLINVKIHGFGSCCIMGGNNWRGVNVVLGNTLFNKHSYWANGDFTNLTDFGFSYGEWHRCIYFNVSNWIIRDAVPNPYYEAPTAMVTQTSSSLGNWGQQLQYEQVGLNVRGYFFDLRGSRQVRVFGLGAHGSHIRDGVIWHDLDFFTVFTDWSWRLDERMLGTVLDGLLVVTNGKASLAQFRNTPPSMSNMEVCAFGNEVETQGNAIFDLSFDTPAAPVYTKYADAPVRCKFSNIKAWNCTGFVLRVDLPPGWEEDVEITFEDCVFLNNTTAIVAGPGNQGVSSQMERTEKDKIKLRWVRCTGVIWDQYQTNLELFAELSDWCECVFYPGTLDIAPPYESSRIDYASPIEKLGRYLEQDTAITVPIGQRHKRLHRESLVTVMASSDSEVGSSSASRAELIIPAELHGMRLVQAACQLYSPSDTATKFGISRLRLQSPTGPRTVVEMLSLPLEVQALEYSSEDAASAYAIDRAHDEVRAGDYIRIHIEEIGDTPPKGAYFTLGFE
ncbi:MAG: hypothetical protein AAGA68_26820 [Pseudomonadota bacterium]